MARLAIRGEQHPKVGVSPFALTTQVLQEDEWTPQVVERRQNELIGHLRQLWRL